MQEHLDSFRSVDHGAPPGALGLGSLLRRYRSAAGLSQEVLAEQAGISVRGLSDLERGLRHVPYIDTLQRLATALQLDESQQADLLSARRAAAARVRKRGPAAPMALHPQLPGQATSLVGRQEEIGALQQLLEKAQLVTLVGTGGVGKTRLALEVARAVTPGFTDGATLVELAAIPEPELVVVEVAKALGLRVELDHRPQAAVVTFLAGRDLLLVLDNCEHVLDACVNLTVSLLENCPNVRVLATSREPLGVEGEQLWRVQPLDDRAAVELFTQRASAQDVHFDAEAQLSVLEVCRVLDRLPLAIELAAARVSHLAPADILPLLQDRFSILKRSARRGSPRQQTLRATVDWSYDLLSPVDQRLLRRLAVFVGSFDLAAATAMGGAETLDALGRLVDKSLVVAQISAGRTRYILLDTLRSYCLEHLHAAGEEALARNLHLNYFVGKAEALFKVTESLDGPTRRLDTDADNLRMALDWSTTANPNAGLRLLAATQNVWWRRSCAEGRYWAKVFLQLCPDPSLARAHALHAAGRLEVYADPARARRLLSEGLELAVRLSDQATIAMMLGNLGVAAFAQEKLHDALEHFNDGLVAIVELGDPRASARMAAFRAWVILTDRNRRDEARAELEGAKQVGLAFNDGWVTALADFGLGLYWRWTGDKPRALDHFLGALESLHAIDEVPLLTDTLLHAARLLADTDPSRATVLAGAGLAAAERGGHFGPRFRTAIQQLRGTLSPRVGSQRTERLWMEAGRLTLDEAVALARQASVDSRVRHSKLSARELDVARHVADGLTTPQIADTLHLSRRTVETHLARIFDKLGVSNRLQVATWLVRATTDGHAARADPRRSA